MKNIVLIIEYDGSKLHGSQKQPIPHIKTVQGEIENALNKILLNPTKTTFAGRTDLGVSADEMYVNFFTDSDITPEKFQIILNRMLIKEISIKKSFLGEDKFNSRYSALKRTYRYILLNSSSRSGVRHNRVGFHHKILDFQLMKEAWASFLGKNDFTSFSKISDRKDPECEIFDTKLEKINDEFIFYITGDSFMRGMVRLLIGATILIGEKKLPPNAILDIIQKKDRSLVKYKAPAYGLSLVKIEYPKNYL